MIFDYIYRVFFRLLFFLIFFFSFISLEYLSADDIFIPENTPFFSKPNIDSELLCVSSKGLHLESIDSFRCYLKKNPAIHLKWHPMMTYADFYKVESAPGHFVWVSDSFQYNYITKQCIIRIIPKSNYQFMIIVAFFVLLFSIYFCYSKKIFRHLFTGCGVFSKNHVVALLVFILFIRLFLLFLTLFFAGNTMVFPTDESGYFQISKDFISGNYSGPWYYTIGLSFFYAPFVVFSNAKTFFDIAASFSLFNACVIAPLSLVLLFFIIQRLTNSTTKAFIVALLWAVLPFCYFPVELHSTGAGVYKSLFAFPYFTSASYTLYYLFLGVGYNALSDFPSTFCVLGIIFLALHLKAGVKMVIVVSFLFAFACLIRINNIFFAPLVAYLFWLKLKIQDIKVLFKYISIALITFLVCFSPQLIVNYIHFESIFTFPYVLHPDDSAKGFLMSTFLGSGSRFLIGCNFVYMTFGVLGLLFIKQNRAVKTIFVFWGLPIILFFCGYPVVGASPIRFILTAYGALLGMVVSLDYWNNVSFRKRLFAIVIILTNCLLVSPVYRFLAPYQFNLTSFAAGKSIIIILSVAIPLISTLIVFLFFRNDRESLLFLLTFLFIFNLGSTYLILILFIAFLFYLIYMFIFIDFIPSLFGRREIKVDSDKHLYHEKGTF
jgi:hypothetical protein